MNRRGELYRRVWLACLAASVLGLACLTAWFAWRGESPGAGRWNVVLITLDTTRADRLGCYGGRHETPAIDELSRQGVRFERCFSPVPLTLPSHCSLMTGLMPVRHGVHDNGPDRLDSHAETLAEILSGHGYATAAVVGAVVLDEKFGLAQGFDHYDDQMPEGSAARRFRYAERRAEKVTDAALEWLEQPHDEPAFMWVHYFDAHAPYGPPDYDPKFAAREPYDAEIMYVDGQLARLNDAIRRHLPGETLVIVAADHGEGLGQHGEDTHGLFAYNQTLRVPLLVRFPDRRHAGSVVRAPVGLVDVLPSILAWLGLESSRQLDGLPLPLQDTSRVSDGPSRALYFENQFPTRIYGWSSLDGVVLDQYKLIRSAQPELYDLDSDPNERTNLFDSAPETAARLVLALEETASELAARTALASQTATVSADDVARLRSLGYVGSPRPRDFESSSGPPDLPNPKDMLGVYKQLQYVTNLLDQRQIAKATELLLQILESEDPHNKRALRLLAAMSLDEPGLRDAAIACLLKTASRDDRPCTDAFVLGKLGVTLLSDQRPAEAVEMFKRMLDVEPNSATACRYLAEACRQLGDGAEAARWQQRALTLAQPSDEPPDWAADAPASVPSYR